MGCSKHVLFLFYVVLPSQHYSTLFVILECFCPQKIYLFFLCNISSLCAISYVPIMAKYVYQLNIWLLFESIWLNSMFISYGVLCPFALKAYVGGNTKTQGLSSLWSQAVHIKNTSTLTWNRTMPLQVFLQRSGLFFFVLWKADIWSFFLMAEKNKIYKSKENTPWNP